MSVDVASRSESAVEVCHVVKGKVVRDAVVEYSPRDGRAFVTPELDVRGLVWPRSEPLPALNVPVSEIVDLLVATGEQLRADPNGDYADAIEHAVLTSPYERRIVENSYAYLPGLFDAASIRFEIEQSLGSIEILDEWQPVVCPDGRTASVRAFPSRLVHVIAGNAPGVAAGTIIMGAVSKSVNLLKLPSNDLFTATAILRAMAQVAPDHPVTASFSAVYWRGGNREVEEMIYRPQFFDKLVAWGGEGTIQGAGKYVGPGFSLVAFDPKTSISLIGAEAFADDETVATVAALAADDIMHFNQKACSCSRVQFIEGSLDQIDRYCELLAKELMRERQLGSAVGPALPRDLKEEIEVLRDLPGYDVWGGYSGEGLVIRSPEPVDFQPDDKTVNVVPVESLKEAAAFINVATQTIGVYPFERKVELRDTLISAGAQRIINLGGVSGIRRGLPHDGFKPLHRVVHWVSDEE